MHDLLTLNTGVLVCITRQLGRCGCIVETEYNSWQRILSQVFLLLYESDTYINIHMQVHKVSMWTRERSPYTAVSFTLHVSKFLNTLTRLCTESYRGKVDEWLDIVFTLKSCTDNQIRLL